MVSGKASVADNSAVGISWRLLTTSLFVFTMGLCFLLLQYNSYRVQQMYGRIGPKLSAQAQSFLQSDGSAESYHSSNSNRATSPATTSSKTISITHSSNTAETSAITTTSAASVENGVETSSPDSSESCSKTTYLSEPAVPQLKRPQIGLMTWKPNGTLASCYIAKAMTTIIQTLLGYLGHAPSCEKFVKKMEKIVWYTKDQLQCLNGMKHVSSLPAGGEIFVILREPISRILSGWLDKCVTRTKTKHSSPRCYGCGLDFECFVKRNYESLIGIQNGSQKPFNEQDHYYPSAWRCPMAQLKKKAGNVTYIPYKKSQETYKAIISLLSRHNVSKELIGDIEEFFLKSSTGHDTKDSSDYSNALKFLSEREDVYQLLLHTYYEDYKQFSQYFKMYPNVKCWLKNKDPRW